MKSVAVVLASVVAAVSAQSVTTLAFACPPQVSLVTAHQDTRCRKLTCHIEKDLYPSVYCPNGSGTNGQTLSCYYGNGMDSSSCALTSKWFVPVFASRSSLETALTQDTFRWCEYSAVSIWASNASRSR